MGFSSARLAPYSFRSAIISPDHFVCELAVATCSWIAETQLTDSRPVEKKAKNTDESTTQTTTTGYRSLHQTEHARCRGVEAAANPLRVLNEEAEPFPPSSPSANRPITGSSTRKAPFQMKQPKAAQQLFIHLRVIFKDYGNRARSVGGYSVRF